MKIFFALLLLVISPVSAFADNYYASAILGNSQNIDSGNGITAIGMSNGIMIGYDVNDYFAVETGYSSLYSSAKLAGAGNDGYINLTGF